MFAFLFSHYLLSGAASLSILVVIGVGLGVGWPLVLNRRVLGALALFLALIGAALWWENEKAALRAEGAKNEALAVVAANKAAAEKRKAQQAAFDADMSDEVKAREEERMAARAKIDAATAQRERKPRVSKAADMACIVPRGFVRDHDAAVPGSAGRSALSAPQADDEAPAPGLVLSRVDSVVSHNYGECAKLIVDLDAVEQQRYDACLAWDRRFGTDSKCTR